MPEEKKGNIGKHCTFWFTFSFSLLHQTQVVFCRQCNNYFAVLSAWWCFLCFQQSSSFGELWHGIKYEPQEWSQWSQSRALAREAPVNEKSTSWATLNYILFGQSRWKSVSQGTVNKMKRLLNEREIYNYDNFLFLFLICSWYLSFFLTFSLHPSVL